MKGQGLHYGSYEEVTRIGQEVNHHLATVGELFGVLQTYVDAVLDESHTLMLAIFQLDGDRLDVYLSEHGQMSFMSRALQGVCKYVIETQQSCFIRRLSEEGEQLPFQGMDSMGTERKESLIFVPLLLGGVALGVLSIQHALPNVYGQEDQFILQLLASYVALGLHNVGVYSGLREMDEARQELEQRALSAEEMSSIGQSAFELTHRLSNDLGVVEAYVTTIEFELKNLGVTSGVIAESLKEILGSVEAVLSFSEDLKRELAKWGATAEEADEAVMMSPRMLLEEAAVVASLPATIEIGVEVEDDVMPVRVIHGLVADILRNLVINAIQAMPMGGRITLRGRNVGRSVALEVGDTGVGIPKERIPKVFDLFFSTKGSSGFGLWSARRNALKNHGDLKVESKLGQGTTFRLLLPRTNGERG